MYQANVEIPPVYEENILIINKNIYNNSQEVVA